MKESKNLLPNLGREHCLLFAKKCDETAIEVGQTDIHVHFHLYCYRYTQTDIHYTVCTTLLWFHNGTVSLPLIVVIVVRDGSGCSGVFMVVYSQLEKLKVEGLVDIFQCIKTMRTKRPGIVADVVRTCVSGRYSLIN